jgi:hypothetical protein
MARNQSAPSYKFTYVKKVSVPSRLQLAGFLESRGTRFFVLVVHMLCFCSTPKRTGYEA